MKNNIITVGKNDVSVFTNGGCVDIRMKPAVTGENKARSITVTLERDAAIRLRDALETYFQLDRT